MKRTLEFGKFSFFPLQQIIQLKKRSEDKEKKVKKEEREVEKVDWIRHLQSAL